MYLAMQEASSASMTRFVRQALYALTILASLSMQSSICILAICGLCHLRLPGSTWYENGQGAGHLYNIVRICVHHITYRPYFGWIWLRRNVKRPWQPWRLLSFLMIFWVGLCHLYVQKQIANMCLWFFLQGQSLDWEWPLWTWPKLSDVMIVGYFGLFGYLPCVYVRLKVQPPSEMLEAPYMLDWWAEPVWKSDSWLCHLHRRWRVLAWKGLSTQQKHGRRTSCRWLTDCAWTHRIAYTPRERPSGINVFFWRKSCNDMPCVQWCRIRDW